MAALAQELDRGVIRRAAPTPSMPRRLHRRRPARAADTPPRAARRPRRSRRSPPTARGRLGTTAASTPSGSTQPRAVAGAAQHSQERRAVLGGGAQPLIVHASILGRVKSTDDPAPAAAVPGGGGRHGRSRQDRRRRAGTPLPRAAASSPPCSPRGATTCAVTRARSRSPAVGRTSPDEDLRTTALREAHEEIGLDPAGVELVGALAPVGTFVTSYRVFPFVGAIDAGMRWTSQETEVERVLELSLHDLAEGLRASACCAAACRSRRPPTRSMGTSCGARPLEWSRTCWHGWSRSCDLPIRAHMGQRQAPVPVGEWIAAFGAICLLAALFRPWYELNLPDELLSPRLAAWRRRLGEFGSVPDDRARRSWSARVH